MSPIDKEHLEKIQRKLADTGKLIEAGWIAYRIAVVNPSASDGQLDEMKIAFMAGAAHLFSSIMVVLEPGNEPTEADLHRMTLINDELDEFGKLLMSRVGH